MDLKKLLEPMEFKMRAWPWGKELAYIDARQAQDRLDEVCWPENWKVEYKEISWNLFAWVSIKVWDEWVTKWDAWSESNIEKEKGHISDSFKRACVTWGIGRFLYSLWAKPKPTQTQDKKPWISTNENCPACSKTCSNIKTGTTKTGKPYEMWNCDCGERFFINRN